MREIKKKNGISQSLILKINTEDLGLRKRYFKFVPRLLSLKEKKQRRENCENMVEMTRNNTRWKEKIVTGDETWVYA